jgi:hypothetical protein
MEKVYLYPRRVAHLEGDLEYLDEDGRAGVAWSHPKTTLGAPPSSGSFKGDSPLKEW